MATNNHLNPTNQNAQTLAQFPIDAHLPPGMWGYQVIKLLERNPHLASEAEAQARIKYVSNEALLDAAIRIIRRVAGGPGALVEAQMSAKIRYGESNAFTDKQLHDDSGRAFSQSFIGVQTSFKQFVKHVQGGGAWSPAYFENNLRRKENFIQAELLAVDFDSNVSVDDLLTLPFIRQYAGLIYATPSDTPETHRSRLVIRLDKPITGHAEYEVLIKGLIVALADFEPDNHCSDAARFYYGSTKPGAHVNEDAVCPVDTLKAFIANAIAGKVAADIELARIATALKHAHLFRVWAVLLQIARETGKLGVSRVLLADKLGEYGITVSERNLRRWLYRGHGLYWQLTETTVYFAGQKKLATRLASYALEHGQSDLIRTNQPGRSRQVYLRLGGSLAEFEAHVYAAWLANRKNPTISRAVLQKLFNRTARILRQWEAAVNVTANTNEAQYHPQFNRDVPDHAIMYEADLGNGLTETRFRARTVNTYHAPIIRQHAKRGQGRRILRAVVEVLQSVEPAGICGQGGSRSASTGGLKPTGRLYFDNTAKALRSRKHSGERARYIRLGEIVTKRPKGLWDYAPEGIQHTSRSEVMRPYKGFDRPIYAKDVL